MTTNVDTTNPEMTELDEYQQFVAKTVWSSVENDLQWAGNALGSEVGETLQILEKLTRKYGGEMTADIRAHLSEELGDIIWNVTNIANILGLSLDEIIEDNISKLNLRIYSNE